MTFYLELSALVYTGRILPMLAYAGLTLLAFFVLSHNPRGSLNRIFFLLALMAALWNVAIFLVLGAGSPTEASGYWKLYELSVLLLVPTWTYFAMRFSGRDVVPLLVYVPSIAFTPLLLFTNLINGDALQVGGFYFTHPGSLSSAYNLYVLFYILYGLSELYRVYTVAGQIDKLKIKWMTIGIGVVVLVGAVDILMTLSGLYVMPLSPAASVFAMLAIAYSFVISYREG